MQEQKITNSALADPNAIEMLRVWIADEKLNCSIRVGFYQDRNINEARAWGIIVSDFIRHLGEAMEAQYGWDREDIVQEILASMNIEVRNPTSATEGEFLKPD